MKLRDFRTHVTAAILTERERCANLAEIDGALRVAAEIRSARPPAFRIVTPQTVAANPDVLKEDVIVAGQDRVVAHAR